MRWERTPSKFKTGHWRELWDSNIPDLDTLKCQARSAAFVTIDIHGTRNCPIEFGLTCFQIRSEAQTTLDKIEAPRTLADIAATNRFQTRCFRVEGKELSSRHREKSFFEFCDTQVVPADKIEEALALSLESSKAAATPNLILVGFGMAEVMKYISQHSGLAQHFSFWVDAQELVTDMTKVATPGVADTLIALGFGGDKKAVIPVDLGRRAGNHSVRVAAILLSIATRSQDMPLKITQPAYQARRKKYLRMQKLINQQPTWQSRRRKRRNGPQFVADVVLSGGEPLNLSAASLLNLFSEYSPLDAGTSKSGKIGWISLPSSETLVNFIQQVNGTEALDGRVWTAVADYDPRVFEAYAEKIMEEKKEKHNPQLTEKKLREREAQKVYKETFDWDETLVGPNPEELAGLLI
ncbi:hypothetical protein B0T16DRAFT_453434 [Cercophora newfieldiana]|uniref:Uncharacterized protein n=1 Tax=Cercophora newfieldiana TaxID=92897 RepID=A0AA40D176_9PEZI|nr:hypothetical protein B0T16DRAFT_453434 [Cercophora newfieldiana]